MKNMKTLLSRLFFSVGSFLLGASVLQLFGWGMTGSAGHFLPMLAVSLLLAGVVRYVRHGRMLLCAVFTLLQWAGTAYITMRCGAGYAALIPSALTAGFVPFHLLMLCQEPGEEYPPTVWYLGLFLHALSLFLLRTDYFAGASAFFKMTALLYFVFVLFALNELGLSHGMAGERRPSPLMRWRNRITTALMALALVIACNLEAIARAADAAVQFVKRIIAAIIAYLLRERPAETAARSGDGGMDLSALAGEVSETPLFWRILEKIMMVIAVLMLAALCVLFIRKCAQLLKKLGQWIMQLLRNYAGQVSDAYEDTVESLIDWGEMRRALRLRREKREKPAPVDWESLSPRESVRMRYRLLRRRAKTALDSQTARQVLRDQSAPVQAADLYDRARYSDAEITREDAEQMKRWIG